MCYLKVEVVAIRNNLDWCFKTVEAKWNKRIGIDQKQSNESE